MCGRDNGVPFLNATRPAVQGGCPEGYEVCNPNTIAENTICYNVETQDPTTDCPITDVRFVLNEDVEGLVRIGFESRDFNETTSLVFSRTLGDNLPITQTRIEYEPCMDSLY